ncbi:MAG: tetratricopeptide repeat protein [Nitrospinae bacterium]|nr:tetratricopeptide repeat protein [Nitrospinota bacterium]
MINKDKSEVRGTHQVDGSHKPEARIILFSILYPVFFILLFAQPVNTEDSPLKEPVKLIKQGDYQNVIQMLDVIRNENSGTILGKRSLYLLGHAYFKSGLFEDALKFFNRVVEEYPPLSDYAEYNIAKVYEEKGDYPLAVETLDSFLKKYPFSRLRARARFDMVKNIFVLNDFLKASTEARNFITEFPSDEKAPHAYYLLGQSLEKAGNKMDAYNAYESLYYNYPLDSFADMAIERILQIKREGTIQLPERDKGLEMKRIEGLINGKIYNKAIKELSEILEKCKDHTLMETGLFNLALSYKYISNELKCIQTLNRLIRDFPESPRVAECLYMLSKIYWNKGDTKKSVQYNNMIISKYPKSVWAGRGMYINARISEDDGSTGDAVKSYSMLLKFPGAGELADEAAWRIGWIYYVKGDYFNAIENFRKCDSDFPDSQYADNSLYWMGRAGEMSRNTEVALYAYRRLAADYPYTYYGQRGYERFVTLSSGNNIEHLTSITMAGFEQNTIVSQWEIDDKGQFHITKAEDLIEMGFLEDAREEIRSIPLPDDNSPEIQIAALFSISQWYFKAESYADAMAVQNRLFNKLRRDEQNRLTKEFWSLLYPLSYWEAVSRSAHENNVDPLLVLSVMRQESAFGRTTQSSANAYGLMQLISGTGEKIYKKVWGGEFKTDILFEPDINIELGTRYLSELLQTNNGNLILALATYNAGPTPVKKWVESFGNLPADEFVEKIRYPETRGYVKKVLRNYENYKRLYRIQNTEARSQKSE